MTSFKTNPIGLEELLRDCAVGKVQLPDFQRSWVWDEDRIKSLIASISQAFPIGALMTLEMKAGAANTFARRPIQGSPREAGDRMPDQLLLDGQQRMTSLYQTCMRKEVVETITPRQKMVKRWFYIDIRDSLRDDVDREEAIVGVNEDKTIRTNFNREVVLDLSTPEAEYESLLFPLNQVFDWDAWQDGFGDHWIAKGQPQMRELFKTFKNQVLQNFKAYRVPVISLDQETSHEAVCLVFEKVNTGGKPLDAFELVTAMYAAQGYRLRDDWFGDGKKPGLQERLQTFGRVAEQRYGVLEKVASTDVLQAIALIHSKKVRQDAVAKGMPESELPAVRATRQSLLDLPLEAYKAYKDSVERGFVTAAKFLHQHNIFRVLDLPYQTQIVPLAAVLAEIGEKWEHAAVKARLARWYWCGIFGELYGSAVESRFAKDIMEVPEWLNGGPEPTTVKDGVFRADRLRTMRSRLSAAYKGIHALLLEEGAKDFRSGQAYGHTVFFDEYVDIHHIFPEAWCKAKGIDVRVYDTVINKTPLSYRTNRILGGEAPSKYIGRLQAGTPGTPPIGADVIDGCLHSHCIDPALLRADDFDGFYADRERRLLKLVSQATGHPIAGADVAPAEEEEAPADVLRDTGIVAAAD